jgi:hypothetical protein
MHTLRTILVCLAFAAADMALPAVPNALEVIDEADESEYHAARRGAHGRKMLRLPASRSRDHVRIAPNPIGSRRLSPNRPAAHRSLRKVPLAASSDPAPAIEDQP